MNSNVTDPPPIPFHQQRLCRTTNPPPLWKMKAPSHATTTTLPSDVQVFEGTDFMNSSDIIIQQFATVQQSESKVPIKPQRKFPSFKFPIQMDKPARSHSNPVGRKLSINFLEINYASSLN